MSRQLELIKQMSERGCIEDPETIDLVIKKTLAIPITELGTNTGSNFINIREFLIEDGSRKLNEDISGELNISDLIGISERLSGNNRLYYAYHLANAFRQPAVNIKWIRFFSAVSIKAMMRHLIRISGDLREVKGDKKFYEAAEKSNLGISDNTTIGEFLKAAKNKTFFSWLPGTSIDNYTENVINGCEAIMLLFSGIETVYCRGFGKQPSYHVENEPGFGFEAAFTEPKTKN